MAEQAKAQKSFNDNKVGSAPYVPAARGGGKTNPKAADAATQAKAEKQRADKAEAEVKRLRAAAGKSGKPAPKAPPVPEEVKVLQKRLKNYQNVLEDDPDDQGAKDHIARLEAQIERAMPSEVPDLAQLHAQLKEVQEEIQSGADFIKKKSDYIDSIKKQILKKG